MKKRAHLQGEQGEHAKRLIDLHRYVTTNRAKIVQTSDFRWALSYTGWTREVVMFETTLVYLCTQNDFRWAK